MALSQNKLAQKFRDLMDPGSPSFTGFPASQAHAFANFANAYDSYALDAADALGNPLSAGSASGFQSALSGLANGAASTDAALAFGNAFAAYWLAAPFAVTTPPPGVVLTTNLVATALPTGVTAALAPIFADNEMDGHAKSDAIASAFHTAAGTIVLTAVGVVTATGAPITVPGVVV